MNETNDAPETPVLRTECLYREQRVNSVERPQRLSEFLEWLAGMNENIPEACRASATIAFGQYDEDHPYFLIEYKRPETDAERDQRLLFERLAASRKVASEKAQLTLLLKKYGTPSAPADEG